MCYRSQAKLITIYKSFWVFIFHLPPVSMRYMFSLCDFMFRKSVSQYFCFQFLTSYSLRYPCVKMLHRVPYLAFRTNSFQNIQPPNPGQRQTVNYVMYIQNIHQIKRPASAHVSLRYRKTRLLLTVEGILFFEQLNLNLVEKKFPINGTSSEFSIKCLKCLDLK